MVDPTLKPIRTNNSMYSSLSNLTTAVYQQTSAYNKQNCISVTTLLPLLLNASYVLHYYNKINPIAPLKPSKSYKCQLYTPKYNKNNILLCSMIPPVKTTYCITYPCNTHNFDFQNPIIVVCCKRIKIKTFGAHATVNFSSD